MYYLHEAAVSREPPIQDINLTMADHAAYMDGNHGHHGKDHLIPMDGIT